MADLRTAVAGIAHEVAMSMNVPLRKMRLSPGDYVPELMPPAEQSTGGGLRALQRLRLVPQKKGHPTLVIGSVNVASKRAELSSYAHVDAIHRRRFKRPVPLDRGAYDNLLGELDKLLRTMNVQASVVEGSPDDEEPAQRYSMEPELDAGASSPSPWSWVLALLVILVALGAFAVWWTHRVR